MSVKIYMHGGKVSMFTHPAEAIIEFGTDSPYFHVDCGVSATSAVGALFWQGVVERSLDEVFSDVKHGRYVDIYVLKDEYLKTFNENNYIKFLRSQIGKKYDKLGIAYLAWLKLTINHTKANKWQKDKDYFCSELAAQAFRYGGLVFQNFPPDSTASPADLVRTNAFELERRIE